MIESEKCIVYTADDEEPNCMNCDCNDGGYVCDRMCGSEHSWWGYIRTVKKEREEE